LISSTASCGSCTTEGATTLFAPDNPTGTPMTIGPESAASATVAKSKLTALAARNLAVMMDVSRVQVMSG
jgi:hypothetical protein